MEHAIRGCDGGEYAVPEVAGARSETGCDNVVANRRSGFVTL